MEAVTYFLISKTKEQDVNEDFKKLLSWLSEQGAELNQEGEVFRISYKDSPHVAQLMLSLAQSATPLESTGRITLKVSRADAYTIRNIKTFTQDVGYRIYNLELNSFLPAAAFIRDLTTIALDPEIQKVFSLYGFEPLFLSELYGGSAIFYARKKGQEEISIINPYLVNYHTIWKEFNAKSREFSYVVSPNIERFVQFIDRDLIPIYSFYEKYNKNLKITNYSDIDVNNPGRKLFVKPLVMQIDDEEYNFFTKKGERGSQIMMDKIRNGETLDIMLNRVLKEWGLADGYLRALVRREIEFDKDRDGYVTPRITVNVYVEKLIKELQGSDRSWDSLKTNN